ncbi:MAG TPA: VOC family protein [Chitinophagaceae bacterium]|nr:VOC family protein [Chitinophagaceae bacterium]MCC6636002.1 VOC family protein [Chitinophagaceae bacterium]HMZ46730.1 VOC family protein [Chitinophagaceae bacterium]HNF29877.1 VOC family protein [Chitinophagaceae bacterium]HNM35216.1 VOC family protein [Chitinophagaceae bacterium]
MQPYFGVEIILYVANQEESKQFYSNLLQLQPILHVPGMTQFTITENCSLGLMPNTGIAKIITPAMPHPDQAIGVPKCEVYLYVSNVQFYYEHALAIGAKLVSKLDDRDWGDKACYFADLDGHIIAFAEKL